MSRFKDAKHLFRLAGFFGIGLVAMILARTLLVPKSFGKYGPYRGDAVTEIASLPVAFAGHQACEACHSDVVDVKTKGSHKGVNCEACHGALAKHVDDPGSVQPAKLDTLVLCVRCHEVNGARPKTFPQITSKDHNEAGLPCETCHQPHSPRIETGVKR